MKQSENTARMEISERDFRPKPGNLKERCFKGLMECFDGCGMPVLFVDSVLEVVKLLLVYILPAYYY